MLYDHLYASLVAILTLGALAMYAVRVFRRGVVSFERTNGVGSALLSKRLVEFGYWALMPLARTCVRARITPDHISWASLVFGLGAGVALATGLLGLGALLALFSALGDILDGQVARLAGKGSAAGEILDASVDRWQEFACIGGLVIFYRGHVVFLAVALLALQGAFMVSYSTAKAEAAHVEPPRGSMRRQERATWLITAAALSSMFAPWIEPFRPLPELQAPLMLGALIVVAVAGNLSAVRRLMLTAQALRAREAEARRGEPPAPGAG